MSFPDTPDTGNGVWYTDDASMIGESEGNAINELASRLWKDDQVPLIVVTIDSLLGHDAAHYTIERYAAELFDSWGIGSERRNYGMLLLVSKGDRKARIEFGSGWDHRHDRDAQKAMDTLIVPMFRREQFSEGILAGARGLDSMARGLALPKPKTPWWVPVLMVGGLVLVVGLIISLFKSGRKGWGWALIIGLGVILFFLLRSAASGGGGAFGGGSSGGGGASGSW